MKRSPIKADLSELDEVREPTGCPRWSAPFREMQPVGFAVPQPHEDWSKVPAKTTQDVRRLAVELAEMRELMVERFSEIQKVLSQDEKRFLRRRKVKRTGKDSDQSVLPFLPTELSPVADAIEQSKMILNRPQDPSDELGLTCSHETWQRAIGILTAHALSVWQNARVVIRPPVISAGPDGSIDIYWTAAPYGLLLNVPVEPNLPATYYGDDVTAPDSNRTSGKFDSSKPIDLGVLMWLAHTAQQ